MDGTEKPNFFTQKLSLYRHKNRILGTDESFSAPHNPEVVGSSPASATIKTPDFDKKSGVFSNFLEQNETTPNPLRGHPGDQAQNRRFLSANTSFVALGEIMLPAEHLTIFQCCMSAFAPGDFVIRVHFFNGPMLVFSLGRTHGADTILAFVNLALHSIRESPNT